MLLYPSNYGPWSEYITGTQGKGFWCKNDNKKESSTYIPNGIVSYVVSPNSWLINLF